MSAAGDAVLARGLDGVRSVVNVLELEAETDERVRVLHRHARQLARSIESALVPRDRDCPVCLAGLGECETGASMVLARCCSGCTHV
jgi:hypothetical protein